MSSISLTQSNVQAALVAFLADILPGVTVVSGQGNLVPEPSAGDFIVITPIRIERIGTNNDQSADVRFTGSIAGTTLTVSNVSFGTIAPGQTLLGVAVLPGTTITAQLTGPGGTGGVGTYQINNSQTVASETMSTGSANILEEATITVQLDFHSADLTGSDMARTFTTAFRDQFATSFFAGLAPPLNGVVPLYADNHNQLPFLNENQQYEWRWVVEAVLQANAVVNVPQQYADSVTVQTVNVPATFGP